MKAAVVQRRAARGYSVAEYLRREEDSAVRHEFRDGEIMAMAGGSFDHSLIIANVIRAVGNRLEGKPCRIYDSNLRVRTPGATFYTYPDATIVCGKRRGDPDDPQGQTLLNPKVIIEVVSPSTEGDDRGDKFRRYAEIESLREYVLISQTAPRVETYLRRGETWNLAAVIGLKSVVKLRSVGIELPLAEVYAGIEWAD